MTPSPESASDAADAGLRLPSAAGLGGGWRRLVPRGRFARGAAALAGGTAIGQAIAALSSPLLTRLYTPSDLGRLGIYSAFVSIAGVATSLRYETAIPAARGDREAADLTWASAALSVGVSLVASAVLWALVRWDLLGYGALPLWCVPVTALGLLLLSLFTVLRYWFIRRGRFDLISRVMVVQSGARVGGQLGLGLLHLGWTGLLVAEVLGRAAGLLRMARQAAPDLLPRRASPRTRRVRATLYRHRNFPLYALPSSALDMAAMMLPLPVIAQLYGPAEAGYFALVQRVVAVPLSLVGASVADAFHNRAAELVRDDPDRLRRFFLRTVGALTALALPGTLLVMLLGPWLFALVFGAQWRTAGELAVLMAPWALAQLVVSPVSRVVYVTGGQRMKLVYDVAALAAVPATVFAARHWHLPLAWSVGVVSGLNVLAYLLYFVVLLRVSTTVRSRSR
ncbi:MAG: hypothetical protein JWM27_2309 [Gemmatimonadetes bacterium]|nr:hypothetical protein [Gemmatimonadota bacterium]